MQTSTIFKIVAVVVVAVMAFSMLAAGFLYLEHPSQPSGDNNPNTLPAPSGTPFTYNLSFDTNALKDLSTIKLAAFTTQTDKPAIDASVLKIKGVSQVASQFQKQSVDSNEWYYIAEVSVKSGTDEAGVVASAFDLNFFDQSQRSNFFAAKYITFNAPAWVMLHNTDLNIDRNFSFSSPVLSGLADLSTSAGDALVVGGTIQVQGAAVLQLSLAEQQNKTQQAAIENQIKIDTNSLTNDTNSAVTDTNTPIVAIDSNK